MIIYRDMSRKTLSRYLMKKLHGDISRRCDKEKWYGKMVRRHLTKAITNYILWRKYTKTLRRYCAAIFYEENVLRHGMAQRHVAKKRDDDV